MHHTTDSTKPDAPRELLTVEAAARRLSIGRTTMYALIRTGQILSVRVGRLRRVPVDALTAYVRQLASTQHASHTAA
ncbi:helix-turn-helix domain-containing protein [Amycolatopsis suaedae]|uniref:DNA-binding protein n=1 Tax=Amycolatopsis suaedae TaxID=2510978 RepID=A0A4Q7JDH0_9PSEU|nr:helix-turn-helix domain-containing protein [Amycolatopsis suaedae]RZQ64414.1 DNA-binding protein [Amycolatopsis suaedae]